MRLLTIFLLIAQVTFAQKFFTRTGQTGFKASVAAFEPVQALNKSTSAILNDKGEIASQLFISAFKFRVALMQEHFNENFMDSDTYPKANFKGKIENFDFKKLSNQAQKVTLSGMLTIRGIAKNITTEATISKNGTTIKLIASFKITPQDFEIKIPSVIRRKIARDVTIDIHYDLVEKK